MSVIKDDEGQSSKLAACVRQLWTELDYTDLTVICGSTKWRVHKAIVCTRSTFFKAACKEQWKGTQDTAVNLDGEEVGAVNAILAYLYLDKLVEVPAFSTLRPIQYEFEVFRTADKYNLPNLSHLAADRIVEHLNQLDTKHRSNFLQLVPAFFNEAPATDDWESILSAILETAKKGIATTAVTTMNKIDPEGMFAEAIMGLVREIPSFAGYMVAMYNRMHMGLEDK